MAKVGMVAPHYPRAVPGCLSAECRLNPADGTVVTTGEWESGEAVAAFDAVRAADVGFDDTSHEAGERHVLRLVQDGL